MSNNNPWRYVQVDEDGLKDNPYLNPSSKPAVETATPTIDTAIAAASIPVTVSNAGNFLQLGNISCVDADGKEFEQYNSLAVRKDIFRNGSGQINFTPYQAIVHCQGQGLFLPSMALSCNIVAALFKQAVKLESNGTYSTLNQDAKNVLDHYKNKGNGTGWHAQNTVIDYNRQRIIHYPIDADFPSHGGIANINASHPKIELPFKKKEGTLPFTDKKLENMTLEQGLNHPLVSTFVKQFTGLADPSDLVRVGQYFQQPAKVWFPTSPVKVEDCTETRAAWFGCYSNCLNLFGNYDLYSDDAARGVRGERKRAVAPAGRVAVSEQR